MDNALPQIINILKKLISFKSVTPKGTKCIQYISDILQEYNFKSIIKTFGSKSERVTNLYSILKHKNKKNICFAGHVDVVPIIKRKLWHHNPFEIHMRNNNIYGRGTVDMKGAIACAITAVIQHIKNKTDLSQKSISFLLTTNEEGNAKHGTKDMLEYITKKNENINLCILGEPTSKNKIGDNIKISRRGSINYYLQIKGKEGHVAYPENSKNPITTLIYILKDIKQKLFNKNQNTTEKNNIEITAINTNNYTNNIIPNTVGTNFNIRYNAQYNTQYINNKIKNIIKKYTNEYSLKILDMSLPYKQKYTNQIQQIHELIKNTCNINTKINNDGGTSDGRFIYQYSDTIEIGLKSNLAHKINEHTSINDLYSLYKIYYNIINDFL